MKWLAVVAAASLALAGCTQVAQFRPVAGDAITSVSIATNDVLLQEGIEILVVPTCEYTEPTYTCTGSTVAGQTITSVATGDEDLKFTVKIDDTEIFSGDVSDVITKAGQS